MESLLSIWKKVIVVIIFAAFHVSSHAEVRDTIKTKQTITPTTSLSNIVIVNGGDLTIKSYTDVVIEKDFDVLVGGQLFVCRPTIVSIRFKYDASGNRTAKRPEEEK